MGLTIETGEYEGKSYDHVLEKSLIEYYQAGERVGELINPETRDYIIFPLST